MNDTVDSTSAPPSTAYHSGRMRAPEQAGEPEWSFILSMVSLPTAQMTSKDFQQTVCRVASLTPPATG
ncbi:hypothetical protein JCM18899A_41490 [Nocardioides sp. AN3]